MPFDQALADAVLDFLDRDIHPRYVLAPERLMPFTYPNNIGDFLPSSVRDQGVPLSDPISTMLENQAEGHDTYLNGHRNGWPHDHSVEDAYEVPPYTWEPPAKANAAVEGGSLPDAVEWDHNDQPGPSELAARQAFLDGLVRPQTINVPDPGTVTSDTEYKAVWGPKGEAKLIRVETQSRHTTIAKFDTFADAETAAEALNNHEGY
jgi:hypothetical protein